MIFVTGGTGLVGAHLLFELTASGEKVKALKRATSNVQPVLETFSYYSHEQEKLFSRIEWVDGDILDYFFLEDVLKGVSEIYHCAAIVSFQKNEREKMIRNNVEGTANLVNAAIENEIKKICHVSSIAALGREENGAPVTEETNLVPSKKVSGYSESKFFSEAEIWRGVEEGLDAVIVNPSIILGPGNRNSGSTKLFKTVANGLKFYTKGVTGFVDVNDVIRAMVLLMNDSNFEKYKNQRFILNAENLSYQTVFNKIATEMDKPKPTIFASDFLLAVAWRLAAAASFITRKQPVITRDTVANSNQINNFDGGKIMQALDFVYLPISKSIKRSVQLSYKEI